MSRVSPEQRWLRTKAEDAFQSELLDVARRLGWLAFHDHDARRDNDLAGVDKGFPDTVLCHPRQRRLIIAELKRETGRVSSEQLVWLGALMQIPAIEVYSWKPRDWDSILEILQHPTAEVRDGRH